MSQSLKYKVETVLEGFLSQYTDFGGLTVARGHKNGEGPDLPCLIIRAENAQPRDDMPQETGIRDVTVRFSLHSSQESTPRATVEDWLDDLNTRLSASSALLYYANESAYPDVRAWAPFIVYDLNIEGQPSSPEGDLWLDEIMANVVCSDES